MNLKSRHRAAWRFDLARTLLSALFALAAHAQSDLNGVIDIHVHSGPDSTPRSIDAIDLARMAKQRGMRGLVLKNHYESTAALAYVVRQVVPGIEIFGGIDLNLTVGGINPAAVERMTMMKGGYGKVVWMPTFDNENQVKSSKENRPYVSDIQGRPSASGSRAGDRHRGQASITLETGHSSPADGLLIVREARMRGVQHIVVTHAMASVVRMTIPQMQEAARDGAFIEFVYSSTLGPGPRRGNSGFRQGDSRHRPGLLHPLQRSRPADKPAASRRPGHVFSGACARKEFLRRTST